jgi:hypothetical protein
MTNAAAAEAEIRSLVGEPSTLEQLGVDAIALDQPTEVIPTRKPSLLACTPMMSTVAPVSARVISVSLALILVAVAFTQSLAKLIVAVELAWITSVV